MEAHHEIVRRTPPRIDMEELDESYRIAKALALSKRFPDARTAEEALAKILIGRDLGMSATQAMMGIHIAEGRPMVAATQLASFVREVGDYDYRILHHSDEECSIEFGRGAAPGRDEDGGWLFWRGSLGVSTFSVEDAKRAGLVKARGAWEKFPRNMVFARAMSNGVRWFAPDATGGVPVYVEGEIEPQRHLDGGDAGDDVIRSEFVDTVAIAAAITALGFSSDVTDIVDVVITDANHVEPNSWSAAKVQMVFAGLTPEQALAEADVIRDQTAEIATITDAEVVADAELSERLAAETFGTFGTDPADAEDAKRDPEDLREEAKKLRSLAKIAKKAGDDAEAGEFETEATRLEALATTAETASGAE